MKKKVLIAVLAAFGVAAAFAQTGGATDTAYEIGAPGPAGGIIFYDKGFTSDGWRYLEAAPEDSKGYWGAFERNVAGTDTAIGSGKQNTQLIINRLNDLGETDRAAQMCAAMDVNGYQDWFLPSKDELDLMYQNLKQKGLGDFSDNWYWSSSQYNSSNVWIQRFDDGVQSNSYSKYSTDSFRAVRAF